MKIYYNEDSFLNLAGIQHFVFCRRQWALIHIEQQWNDNIRTVEGSIFHENAHNGAEREARKNTLIIRAMPVCSRELGINGVCDVVEFKRDNGGIELFGEEGRWLPAAIEYKKGSPKEDDSDRLQLAAQTVCLEEMLLCKIEKGYLFYGETRRRTEVLINDALRKKLYDTVKEMHGYYDRSYTPKVKTGKKCKACSLNEICMPKLCGDCSAKEYINKRISETEINPCE